MTEAASRRALELATTPARIALIVVLALILRLIAHRAIKRLIAGAAAGTVPIVLRPLPDRARSRLLEVTPLLSERRRQRADTIGSVLRSVTSLFVFGVAGAMILAELGFNLGPVVASAGIVGVAVGFGAQNLIKDFLNGIFMILEDQYGVGDVIDAGQASGTVEEVALRTTRLRDDNGTVWHVRNGEILRIGNHSQREARARLDVPIPWDSDVDAARAALASAAASLRTDEQWAGKLLEQPEVWAVEDRGADGVLLRVAVRTAPRTEWAVTRELRERVKSAFDEAGILVGVPLSDFGTTPPNAKDPESPPS